MNYGFFRTAAASLQIRVANPSYNKCEIIKAVDIAASQGAKLLVTPELSVTGYTCADLFFTNSLYTAAMAALGEITAHTKGLDIVVIVGAPLRYHNSLYNCAVVISGGKILGAVPKTHIANYNEFYEKRWFAPGTDFKECKDINICSFDVKIGSQLFDLGGGAVLGIELCEDLWVPCPPSGTLAMQGANIIANLSASDEYVSKAEYRRELIRNQSARCIASYIYAGACVSESTTDLLFGGALFAAENGAVLAEGERFTRGGSAIYADVDIEKLCHLRLNNTSFENISCPYMVNAPVNNAENDLKYRYIDKKPFVPADDERRAERCREILSIQAQALATRLAHVGSDGVVIGISGGLDSTLALIVSCRAMEILGKKSKDILCITMPGFGTTGRTYNNALKLARQLKTTVREISIKDACLLHFKDIGHSEEERDITYENVQARERTQVLFDMANKHKKLLVGTGDLSELAMGWCTYNADHMSMYGVNASVPKTLVRYLVEYAADSFDKETAAVLYDILATPVSPELLPPDENGNISQKTEESIGSYELHDFFLYNFVRFGFSAEKLSCLAKKAFAGCYGADEIDKTLQIFFKRFFANQFKRSCVPDSPKVGSVSLSPRGDWRMPSDASVADYLNW
ncbi:MAG: NAD(+) synthase [Clostridiales bacterium]|nr:NAD(+) synthase [Clostridiales bacterium]